jgi:hypothetical protein
LVLVAILVATLAVITLVWLASFLVDLDRDRQNLAPADCVRAVSEERRTVGAVLAAIGAAIRLWYPHLRHQLDRRQLD